MARDKTVSIGRAVLRGIRCRCPNCGHGRLLKGYLKVVDRCDVCSEAYGQMRADDAPPWITILLVGHLVVPSMLIVEREFEPPLLFQQTFWPVISLLLALALLPRSKCVVLALLWSLKAEGSEIA